MTTIAAIDSSPPRRQHRSAKLLRIIGAFKLVQAVLMILLSLAVLHVLKGDIAENLRYWVHEFHLDPEGPTVRKVLDKILDNVPRLKQIAIGSLLVAAVFTVEGIGLVLAKRWGEWVALIASSALIPFEIYECITQRHLSRVVLLLINVLIVLYLARHVYKTRGHHAG